MNSRQAIFSISMLLAATAAVQIAHAEPAYKLLKKVAYAQLDEGPLTMDVVAPTGKSNGVGIIDVASGAGFTRINELGQERIAEIFCGRGYTLFVVRPGPTIKYNVLEMTNHVEKAIVFVKENADQYQVDPDDLGLLSTSTGVHLVALVVATTTRETAVKAAGVYFPPTDFRDKDAQNLYVQSDSAGWEQTMKQAFPGSGPESSVVADGGGLRDPRAQMPQVSKRAPQFLIVHGDLDPLVSLGEKNLLFTAMRDAGVATDKIVRRPGREPGPTIQAELKTLANWFDRQLALE